MTTNPIESHVESYLDKIDIVLRDTSPDSQHINILIVKATTERPFHLLITSGMSDSRMNIPENVDVPAYIELVMVLPPDWPLPNFYEVMNFNKQRNENYWPFSLLKDLAIFPHAYATWLGFGHTIPNGDPPIPFASNTALCSAIILPPLFVPREFTQLYINENKTIHFFSVAPLYQEEMLFKIQEGTDALLSLFNHYKVSEYIVPNRINVATAA